MSTVTLTEKDVEQPVLDLKLVSEKEKQELIAAETASIVSGTTIGASSLGASSLSFHPAKSFHINTKGIPVLRLPLPPSELIITVHNFDGSIAYQSTRERRSSGNCVLTNSEGQQLIGTTYFFGPGKDPFLKRVGLGDGEENIIKTISRWTSRTHKFLLHDGRTFTWEYKKEKGFGGGGKKGVALVLTMDGKRIAALIRNEETRTPGSKSCSAGNGGELVLGEEIGGKDAIGEEVVVATCLLMLKKEIDRRRAVQATIIVSAASGGP